MKIKYAIVMWIACFAGNTVASGQLLNKLKQKAEQKAEKALDKKLGLGNNGNNSSSGTTGNDASGPGGSSGSSGSGNDPQNKGGGGLISTPPDVNQNLSDAETSYKSGNYGEARYAVQQAMLGVELEIGNKILASLPATIDGMDKDEKADQVTSTGYGWAGLTILRKYNDTNEKQLKVTVANNSVWMASLNMYLSNGGYAQTSGGEQNWKQTKLKGYRAIIEYDEGSGYKLSVPIGQSSLIVYEGINIADETEMMKAAGEVDIDQIKNMLGEQ